MKITHIKSQKDQWIFEYPTQRGTIELKQMASKFREEFGAEFEEVNAPSAERSPTAE